MQDSEVGDGTTSVTVLASELIREAEKLVEMRIHPQTIIAGWRQASKVGGHELLQQNFLIFLYSSSSFHDRGQTSDKISLNHLKARISHAVR